MINQETRLYPYSEDYILEINNLLIDYKMKKSRSVRTITLI